MKIHNHIALFFPLAIIFVNINLYGQTDSSISSRNNIIKVNLISLPPLFNNLNQKWIGIEYQRIFNNKFSVSIATEFGNFQDYTYTKYHDFFDEDGGFSYTQEDVLINGFHIIPSVNYMFFNSKKTRGQGIYFSGKIDYYYYVMKKDVFVSATNSTDNHKNSTTRLNLGAAIGAQYIIRNRFSLDLNISFFTKLFSVSTNKNLPELYPENSFWKSTNNKNWTTINLMLGYTFGNKKHNRSIN